jgi:hypothetical protein
MVNLKAMIVGFVVTLILLPFLNVLAPLIGGILVGYMVEGVIGMGSLTADFQ